MNDISVSTTEIDLIFFVWCFYLDSYMNSPMGLELLVTIFRGGGGEIKK